MKSAEAVANVITAKFGSQHSVPPGLVDDLPVAVYMIDAAGKITYFNQAAADFWGQRPEIGKDEWCGAWKLYWADGTPLPHDQCPMAMALKQKKPIRGLEMIAERRDGTRVPVIPYPTPLFDENGVLTGAVNLVIDISERKKIEHALQQRRDEQAALYQFTDQLHRAEHPADIYESALDAITGALKCSRASILLFDDTGVMKFVAWRNLSEAYREAVEGHSPWAADTRNPEPIFIDDVAKTDLDDSLKATVEAEGIGALGFIPLVAGGRLVGKFMTYYDAPHVFTDAEAELALTIARQLGFSLARSRTEEDKRRLDDQAQKLALIVESSDDAIISKDLTGKIASWNRGAEHLFGYTKEEAIGRSVLMLIPERLQHEEPNILQRIRNGERIEHYETIRRRKDGSEIHISLTVSPVRDTQRRVIGASKIARDITERKRADAQRELLVAELSHRVKNTLATVISIQHQSFSKAPSIDEARQSFGARIRALAQTHSRLAEDNWSGVWLERMLLDEFEPYRGEDGSNVTLSGPPVRLNPKSALTLGMALHELTTNAAKYGALSDPKAGRVNVGWQIEPKEGHLNICWSESGGPPVSPPKRSGFGRLLLERALGVDLRSDVQLDFAKDGLKCTISLPLDETVAGTT